MRVKTLDFELDNAERNKTDYFKFQKRAKVVARRGNVFNFKIDLSQTLHQWRLKFICKKETLSFTNTKCDMTGWTVNSTTIENTSIWRVSVPLNAQIGIYKLQLSLFHKNSKEYVSVEDTFFVLANPFEPRSMVYNELEPFLKEYLLGVHSLVYNG